MTRMAGHKISDDGTRIVCTAPPDAVCRTRPDCDTEAWGDLGCNDHDPLHPNTPGHNCWAVEWTNTPDVLGHTCAYDPHPEIFPGRVVVLTWYGDGIGIGWTYRTLEDA